MKKTLFVSVLLLATANCFLPAVSFSQGRWTRKADMWSARGWAVGFSIGAKGYIGTGDNCVAFQRDFWEWDQATDTWTQKAIFGGLATNTAVAFSIGSKGYIGTGYNDTGSGFLKALWEWDQANNTWTQKADFGGTARHSAAGFSIGAKGYIGTGNSSGSAMKQDFWEWDQAANTWTKKSDFGGTARSHAVGFSIGAKGYIGTGQNWNGSKWTRFNDFWEWDQATDVWTQKADFGGVARESAVGFSIGAKGYIGTGTASWGFTNDFWEWDQAADTWTSKSTFGGSARTNATGFSIGSKGYIGTGIDGICERDFWEYSDSTAAVGLNELSNPSGILVFPNPSAGELFIHADHVIAHSMNVTIFNAIGETMIFEKINMASGNEIKLDLKNKPNGIYLMEIKTLEGTVNKKIVLNK